MRKILVSLLVLVLPSFIFAQAASEQSSGFVASTSWTASYAYLAGVDDITVIAPSSLRHPPEYELTASDIVTVQNADFFVSAGYERMMSTIQESIESDRRTDIHISTGNSRQNIAEQAEYIASFTGTTPRYDDYVDMVDSYITRIDEEGIDEVSVYCQAMLLPLAQDLGLNITGTFQGQLTASQIEAVMNGTYDVIIDNYHSPSMSALEGQCGTPVIQWRNFPETATPDALETMVRQNVESLLELYD